MRTVIGASHELSEADLSRLPQHVSWLRGFMKLNLILDNLPATMVNQGGTSCSPCLHHCCRPLLDPSSPSLSSVFLCCLSLPASLHLLQCNSFPLHLHFLSTVSQFYVTFSSSCIIIPLFPYQRSKIFSSSLYYS